MNENWKKKSNGLRESRLRGSSSIGIRAIWFIEGLVEFYVEFR